MANALSSRRRNKVAIRCQPAMHEQCMQLKVGWWPCTAAHVLMAGPIPSNEQ